MKWKTQNVIDWGSLVPDSFEWIILYKSIWLIVQKRQELPWPLITKSPKVLRSHDPHFSWAVTVTSNSFASIMQSFAIQNKRKNGTTIVFDWAIDLQAGDWSFFTFLFAENYVYWQLWARIFMWLMCNAMGREERRKCFKLNDFNDRWPSIRECMSWSGVYIFGRRHSGKCAIISHQFIASDFVRMTMSTGRKMCWIITHTLQFMSCTRLMCTDETA